MDDTKANRAAEQSTRQSRLLIVSNRLPFTVTEEDGELCLKGSSGGLVSGLSAYLERTKAAADGGKAGGAPYLWIGWPGGSVAPEKREELRGSALRDFSALPVFVDEEAMEKFYHGFCNATIWPLFHYFPMYTLFEEDYWEEYREVNRVYAQAVLEVARPGDTIWIHDYHLMLLPKLIRDKMPDVSIGFFLHIPFPGFELYRLMPRKWGAAILKGMLGADLIGFHTHEYTQYFLRTVMRELGYEHSLGEIMVEDRLVKADTFPMGIDFTRYHDAADTPEVRREKNDLLEKMDGARIILSIDRLDYTKGIINRLRGFERFLEMCPEWRGKVVLALVIVPSRIAVEQYQQTREEIERLVGRIAGRFGSISWTPVTYQYRSIPFETLIAMYSASDVGLITPLRDGMNLIAKEYVAAHADKRGVLILSEFAGAAKELGEAIIINPNSREEIADALHEALELSPKEREWRMERMQERLERCDLVSWADDFIRCLADTRKDQDRFKARLLSSEVGARMLEDYRGAKRRLIMLDYDGTLVPFQTDPQQAAPGKHVTELIRRLAADPRNEIVLISGRDKATLQKWFSDLPIGVIAEHGAWSKQPRAGAEWVMNQAVTDDWKPSIRPVLQMYANRLPGSFLEEKDYAIAWHYRAADPDLGPARAKELLDHLVNYTANISVQVLQGNKVIEVKTAGVNKGTAGLQWLRSGDYEFVLAFGDDWTDEQLFMALPDTVYSIRVGMVQSYARHNVREYTDVLELLEELAEEDRVGMNGSAASWAPA